MKIKMGHKTTREEMMRKIFGQVIKWDDTANNPALFVNIEGDWVITYQQGRKKYVIAITETN